MTLWTFRTPVTPEAPASWGDRMFLRVKLNRGVSVFEGPPGQYEAIRFPTVEEIASATTAYMGGHEYLVDDATRAALMAAGVGVTSANFTPIQGDDMGVSTVNGDPGPDVVLIWSGVGAARQITVRSAYITTGNILLPNTGGLWAAVSGLELDLPAVAGDYVELTLSCMYQPSAATFIDPAVIKGATLARYASSGGPAPSTVNEGDPTLYNGPGTYRTSGTHFGFQVTSGDLDAGNVRFVIAALSANTGGAVYASTDYPFRWTAKNYGPVL